MSEEVIKLENVVKDFTIRTGTFGKGKKNRALDKVNVTVSKGEILGVVGESGSGKTTLGFLMLGLTQKDSGKIYFEGKNIDSLSMCKRDFSHSIYLFPSCHVTYRSFLDFKNRITCHLNPSSLFHSSRKLH